MRSKKIEAIMRLPGHQRYAHTIKQAWDEGGVWSIRDDAGWLCVGDEHENMYMPLWPHESYAELYRLDGWQDKHSEKISMSELLKKWCVELKRDGYKVCVFPTSTDGGVAVCPERLKKDLLEYGSELAFDDIELEELVEELTSI